MTREPILALLAREPFLPFRLHMTGGSVYESATPNGWKSASPSWS